MLPYIHQAIVRGEGGGGTHEIQIQKKKQTKTNKR